MVKIGFCKRQYELAELDIGQSLYEEDMAEHSDAVKRKDLLDKGFNEGITEEEFENLQQFFDIYRK